MPLTIDIDHEKKLVHVVAEGPTTLADMEQHFDKLVLEDVLSYAKIFDATHLVPVYSEHDMYMLGARLSAYADKESGPLAVIGTKNEVLVAARRFFNLSSSSRPAKIFPDVSKARAWLETQR